MRLTRLKIEQLRQFRLPLEIVGFEPGLNLFTGPNEAGKSTVVRAIRAAFFERYRSTSVDDLQPWGDTSASPSIELNFEIGGTEFHLRKSFLHRKRCDLRMGSRELDGEDAEQHLADLLGFEFSGRGASRPEHWGIPGLLWIEQGRGQEIQEVVGNATDHLRKALDQSIGEVASSQGDDVIARIRSDRDSLLTSTGRPRGDYSVAIADREALAQRIGDLDSRIANYRLQVDQLDALRAEDATDKKSKPWEGFRAQQHESEARLAEIQAVKAQLEADLASLKQLDENYQLVGEQLGAFEVQQRALKDRETTLVEARARVETAKAANERWASVRREAEIGYQQANESLTLSRQQDLRAEVTRRMDDTKLQAAKLADALQKAEFEQGQLAAYRKLAVETEISKADIKRLHEQHADLKELQIRQEAAATRLQFDLKTEGGVALDGQALAGQGEKLISASAKLSIRNIGTLLVIPGGTDLAQLARDEAEQLGAHRALLQRLAIASLVDAESRYESHKQALLDIKHTEKTLTHLAPNGVDSLRSELAEQYLRKVEAEGQLSQLPPAPPKPAEALAQAATRHKAASTHLEKITQQGDDSRQTLATAEAQADAALRERDALQKLLSDPAHQQKQRETGQRLVTIRAERDSVQQRVSERIAAVETAHPDILTQDVERLRRSADQTERLFRDRQTDISLLQGKLEEAGTQGLEEERAELAIRAEAAERRFKELKLRADALDLLLSLLVAKRHELTMRLQAPLQVHINHYLQLLFPKGMLEIGEDLSPRILMRGSRGEEFGQFESLSFGAREQLGVISRLAYADLLKAAGRPTLIILDDALVHSDDQRLEQMKRVLFDAAKRHQVLLFTCHPAAWRGLGATPRAIAQLNVQAASSVEA